MFGLLNLLYPLFSKFASITDAGLQFNELVIIEGYYPQAKLIENITNHYVQQGTRKIFRIIGSSELIGNPTGLVDKVGVGFLELARDPIQGIQESPEAFLRGIGTGLQGVVRGVIGGTFTSLSSITGSLYQVVKETTGGRDIRDRRATNVRQGVY